MENDKYYASKKCNKLSKMDPNDDHGPGHRLQTITDQFKTFNLKLDEHMQRCKKKIQKQALDLISRIITAKNQQIEMIRQNKYVLIQPSNIKNQTDLDDDSIQKLMKKIQKQQINQMSCSQMHYFLNMIYELKNNSFYDQTKDNSNYLSDLKQKSFQKFFESKDSQNFSLNISTEDQTNNYPYQKQIQNFYQKTLKSFDQSKLCLSKRFTQKNPFSNDVSQINQILNESNEQNSLDQSNTIKEIVRPFSKKQQSPYVQSQSRLTNSNARSSISQNDEKSQSFGIQIPVNPQQKQNFNQQSINQDIDQSIIDYKTFDQTLILQNQVQVLKNIIYKPQNIKYKQKKFTVQVKVIELLQVSFVFVHRGNTGIRIPKLKFLAGDESGVAVFFINYSDQVKKNTVLRLSNCVVSQLSYLYEISCSKTYMILDQTKQQKPIKLPQKCKRTMPGISITKQPPFIVYRSPIMTYMTILNSIGYLYKNFQKQTKLDRMVVLSIIKQVQNKDSEYEQADTFREYLVGDYQYKISLFVNFKDLKQEHNKKQMKLENGKVIILKNGWIGKVLNKNKKNKVILIAYNQSQIFCVDKIKFHQQQIPDNEWLCSYKDKDN